MTHRRARVRIQPRMKKIPQSTTAKVLQLLDAGESARQIAKKFQIGATTVNRVRKKGRSAILKAKGGRPAKLSAATKRHIRRVIMTAKADTAIQITKQLRNDSNMVVSPNTVRRALKEGGLRAVTKKKKPRLTSRQKRLRMEFALRHKEWTLEDWKRVVWSDETKINRLGSDGRKWVWKKPGSAIKDQHVQKTVKHGGGSLMMWGCMTAQGIGYACRIDGTMNAELYTSILEDELLQTLEYYGVETNDMVFQQDDDPKHTSHLATQWFSDNEMEVLQWPPQSPDLNPIEHLWQHLKRQLAEYEEEPKSVHELWERVEAEWNKIPPQVCMNLIESMPSRVTAVLKAKGGYTKY